MTAATFDARATGLSRGTRSCLGAAPGPRSPRSMKLPAMALGDTLAGRNKTGPKGPARTQ
eukprot:1740054-Pyramimonas_sp.AAC.1